MTDKKKSQPNSKRAPRKRTELTTSTMILTDIVSIFFTLMPSVFAYSMTGLFIFYGFSKTWLVLPLAPFVLFASFIATLACIRICLPTLKPGRYKRELNKDVIAWYCHFALSRAAKITGLTPILQSFNTTKYLYWRALGAKVAFNLTNSFDVDLMDYPLITIGKGVTLASQSCICCHSDIGNFLLLGPVVIEEDVFISMGTVIGPNTTIKKGAWIGYRNAISNQVIEENTKVDNVKSTDPTAITGE